MGCKTCNFAIILGEGETVECRFNPPTVVVLPQVNKIQPSDLVFKPVALFPQLHSSCWCGQYIALEYE